MSYSNISQDTKSFHRFKNPANLEWRQGFCRRSCSMSGQSCYRNYFEPSTSMSVMPAVIHRNFDRSDQYMCVVRAGGAGVTRDSRSHSGLPSDRPHACCTTCPASYLVSRGAQRDQTTPSLKSGGHSWSPGRTLTGRASMLAFWPYLSDRVSVTAWSPGDVNS